MEIRYIFDEKSIPLELHSKKDWAGKGKHKEALYDRRSKKYLTRFEEQYLDPGKSNTEYKWWKNSGGKYLLIESSKHQFLFINYEMKLHYKGQGRLSFMSGRPNDDYIVRGDGSYEFFVEINTGKEVLKGEHNSVYPSTNFPKTPYYKATAIYDGYSVISHAEAIFKFPSGERMTPYVDNISSIGLGALGAYKSRYYAVDDKGQWIIMRKWNKIIIDGLSRMEMAKIMGDYDEDLTERAMIKNWFGEE